ncbi:hypothetical protein E2C01_061999 [Portunus trituberculatus]|uniref:Uncharacterized protein n=1 Tax=Portunus trituberculatus TaxID=210409 RepID=A0A5B7HCG5_PORTR|nr:hypothetical protein [Portunus trituberculatus]
MGVRLSFSSPIDDGDDGGGAQAGDVQGPSPFHRPSLEGPALVPTSTALVSFPSTSQQTGSTGPWRLSVWNILQLSRVEFLQACLNTSLSPAVSSDVIKWSRDSTLHQYESAWKAFQLFLRNWPFSYTGNPRLTKGLCS